MKETFKAFRTFCEEEKYVNRIVDLPVPEPEEGQVLIKVEYSSVNYKDALSSVGNKGVTRNYPHTPGIDAAGIVEKSKSKLFVEGEKVLVTGYDLGMNTDGGFGEYILVPDSWPVSLPSGMSLKESMTYGTAGFTAALCVYGIAQSLDPKDGKILVTGAGGGVGSHAVKFLAKLGYEVIALSRRKSDEAWFKEIGAHEVMTYDEFNELPKRPLNKPIAKGVVDTLGGDVLARLLSLTAYGGCIACCGNVVGGDMETTVYPFILRGITLKGIDSANTPRTFREKIWQLMAHDYRPEEEVLGKGIREVNLNQLQETLNNILAGVNKGRNIVRL